MERESHSDGKTGKSAAGRIRLSREPRVIARDRERGGGARERERESESESEKEREREIRPRAGRLYRAHICRVLQIPPRDSARCSEREKKEREKWEREEIQGGDGALGWAPYNHYHHRHRRRTVTLTL